MGVGVGGAAAQLVVGGGEGAVGAERVAREVLGFLVEVEVAAVLEAERMPRERLYAWLEDRGYQWRSASGIWVQRKQSGGSAGEDGKP